MAGAKIERKVYEECRESFLYCDRDESSWEKFYWLEWIFLSHCKIKSDWDILRISITQNILITPSYFYYKRSWFYRQREPLNQTDQGKMLHTARQATGDESQSINKLRSYLRKIASTEKDVVRTQILRIREETNACKHESIVPGDRKKRIPGSSIAKRRESNHNNIPKVIKRRNPN